MYIYKFEWKDLTIAVGPNQTRASQVNSIKLIKIKNVSISSNPIWMNEWMNRLD